MKNTRAYAKAIFEYAHDNNCQLLVKLFLENFSEFSSVNEDNFLSVFAEIVDQKAVCQSIYQNIAKLIRHLSKYEIKNLIDDYNKIYRQNELIIDLEVNSSFPLEQNTLTNIADKLKKKFAVKEVFIKNKVDPKIIAGLSFLVNENLLLDKTLNRYFSSLKNYLIS